jgi:hypothetical protein
LKFRFLLRTFFSNVIERPTLVDVIWEGITVIEHRHVMMTTMNLDDKNDCRQKKFTKKKNWRERNCEQVLLKSIGSNGSWTMCRGVCRREKREKKIVCVDLSVCKCMCMCVCMCVWEREKEAQKVCAYVCFRERENLCV